MNKTNAPLKELGWVIIARLQYLQCISRYCSLALSPWYMILYTTLQWLRHRMKHSPNWQKAPDISPKVSIIKTFYTNNGSLIVSLCTIPYLDGTHIQLNGVCIGLTSVGLLSCWLLTHWGWDKMDAISQTTFWSAFSWMKMFEFLLQFHWSLFLRVQLTIFQHWFR